MARLQQGRFEEAAAHLSEAAQRVETSFVFAFLADALGHLGRIEEVREAIAGYRALCATPIAVAADVSQNEDHRKLFLDGLALAEEA